MEQMAALGGMILVIFAVMMVLGLLVGGLVLKFSVRLLQGFSPSYGKSILVVFLAGVAGFIINLVLTMVMAIAASLPIADGSAMPAPTPITMVSTRLMMKPVTPARNTTRIDLP